MGSYNSINFTKLIVNGIPYNKAYMGSKILFENNNPFTLEITGYDDGNQFAKMKISSGQGYTLYITTSHGTFIHQRNSNSSEEAIGYDATFNTYFEVGEKIHLKVVYNNLDNTKAGVVIRFTQPFKVYGDILTYSSDNYCRSMFNAGNSGTTRNQNVDISGLIFADTTDTRCYQEMFYRCNFVNTETVTLPATTLNTRCYQSMFAYTNISDITINASEFSTEDYVCYNMLNGTSTQAGILHLPDNNNYPSTDTSWLPTNWTIQPIGTPLQTNPITVTSLAANNRIYFKCLSATGTVKYNNNTEYQTLSEGDEITLGTIGNQETLQIKYAYTGTVSLMGTGDFTVSGDIIDVNGGVTPRMFKNSTHLTSAKNLVLSPVTLTHDECYMSMFEGCTGLTSAGCPDLIATTLTESCYDSMFKGCTGLKSMVYFKFDKDIVWADYCCYKMYQGCTGIDAAEISTTGYPTYWYPDSDSYDMLFCYMFEGCTNLNQLYVWGDSNGYVNYFNHIIDNCSQTGVKKIFIQEDTDFMYGNVNNSNVKPTGWTIEEDDDNF